MADDHCGIGVPFARAINPVTKTNWEGKGIEPDVKVPADQALDVATKLAAQRIDEHKRQPPGGKQQKPQGTRPRTSARRRRLMATIETRVFSLRDARKATVRTAAASDAADVLAFRKAVSDETEFLMGAADEIRRDIAQQAEFLQTTLRSPLDLLVLAEVEGRVAGLAGLEGSRLRRFAHGVTLGMAVGREFWRLGIGRALLESLLLWADTHGVVRIALEVVETNMPAIRLYESLGFEHEGRLRARRKHGDVYLDDYMMARVRSGPGHA